MSIFGKKEQGLRIATGVVALGLAGVVAMPVLAAPQGCFERRYSEDHLARNPAQVVQEMSVAFGGFAGDDVPWMDVTIIAAPQGHAADAGQGGELFGTIARCTPSDVTLYGWSCSVECDGGTLHIEQLDDRKLKMWTEYFLLGTGDDCGGALDLAEVPLTAVTYHLNRVPDARCEGRWP
ncbi:MAG: hypothetical protein AB8B60_04085 [Sulfitobacter sp.]